MIIIHSMLSDTKKKKKQCAYSSMFVFDLNFIFTLAFFASNLASFARRFSSFLASFLAFFAAAAAAASASVGVTGGTFSFFSSGIVYKKKLMEYKKRRGFLYVAKKKGTFSTQVWDKNVLASTVTWSPNHRRPFAITKPPRIHCHFPFTPKIQFPCCGFMHFYYY
ncbi:hypothetical protein BDA99DRAFT_99826 [Phascolomyces articulosus]|uniref:Uncharacterized protein n=1 Tax=Phascolomyces articulosus TaxID=60185 RepID=A0AAD5JWZ7_9FUNG|nr:hypothetical protein BDA99DRAFT_99826 [Phascolomyces articulosus]